MTFSSRAVLHRVGAVLAAAGIGLGLAGCGQISSSSRQIAALRIIDASPDAGGLDLYANATALAYNVGFGTTSSYVTFTPGTYTLTAHTSGTATVLTSTRASLTVNVQYTLLLGNVAAGLQTLLLQDQGQAAPSGQIALRFIDQATRAGAVDVYLVPQGGSLLASIPILNGLTFATAASTTHYLNVPNGAYTLVVLPTGTVPTATTVPSYSGAVVTYPAGSARTLILLDQQLVSTSGVQVVTVSDYDSAVATS